MSQTEENVVLVDAEDRETGLAPKLEAHRNGLRHRAISVCILDKNSRMLLQKRAAEKYHSGGLWTNACCTHPRQNETVRDAAVRRLKEELGIACDLTWVLRTHYDASMGNGLFENEVVHLFVGTYFGEVVPDPREVEAFEWVERNELLARIASRPEDYTYWFRYYVDSFAAQMFSGIAA